MNVDNTKEAPTLLSFCTGYGGIERGIERVVGPCRVVAHVEIESFAIANLVDKMETGRMVPAPVWTNLKTFPMERFRGKVDILTGGYPCQPFSSAGKRAGTDDPRHLWPYIRKAIQSIRPALCFFENVEGHISLGLSTVISDLEEDGYLTTWGIFSAAEVGAPHQRKRVFVMAQSYRSRFKTLWHQSVRQWEPKIFGQSGELAHDGSKRTKRVSENDKNQGAWTEFRTESCWGCESMADSIGAGLERHAGDEYRATGQGGAGSDRPTCEGGIQRWPARPGEEQYEWEPPRVI